MWSARILSGSQFGQITRLKTGRNIVGRGQQCDLVIPSQGVSKEHCEINIYSDKIMLVDLKSSNGTYLNGVRIQNAIANLGDKIAVHDVIFDLVPQQPPEPLLQATSQLGPHKPAATHPPSLAQHQPMPSQSMQHPQIHPPPETSGRTPESRNLSSENLVVSLLAQLQAYMERVALPGLFKIAELTEFKWILGGFIGIFIFFVTILSMFPMMQITKDSIVSESMRRASSLARSVAQVNQQAFLQKNFAGMNTHSAESEEGVTQAVIIDQLDASIVAPASRLGQTMRLPFALKTIREGKSIAELIDSNTIAASYPISAYDPNSGEPSVRAYAIVVYDISSMAFDTGRAISLFMQTLVIASVIGLLIFYFMYHLIEFPIRNLNSQLDEALKTKNDDIRIRYEFPVLQQLITNINSLLTRAWTAEMSTGGGNQASSGFEQEAENLVQMMMLPCVALTLNGDIISCNVRFEQFARRTTTQLIGQNLTSIGDAALQQNIEHLVHQGRENPFAIHSDRLDFSGQACMINAQTFSNSGNIEYFLVVIAPDEGSSS
jgi:pSer/pThr/pTyr-binding forkhead associated (FHA) protein